SNFLEKFIELFVEEKINSHITKNQFKIKFSEWCKENKHRELSDTSLGLEMRKLGYEGSIKNFDWMNDGKGGTGRIWLDIKWKE
ncbi:hypothetical protein LCGC14_3094020, partial [marine sediment metagenome]